MRRHTCRDIHGAFRCAYPLFFHFCDIFCGRGGEIVRNFAHEFLIRRNEVSSPMSEKGFFVERISSGLARLATCGERMRFGHFVKKNCAEMLVYALDGIR